MRVFKYSLRIYKDNMPTLKHIFVINAEIRLISQNVARLGVDI